MYLNMEFEIIKEDIKQDTIYNDAANTQHENMKVCEMIVDCYKDNKSTAIEVFGWYNVYISHYNYLNYKLNFHGIQRR